LDQQKPLELILARNFLTSLTTPAFLVGEDGELLYYNEAAGALLGMSFEEAGRMSAAEWGEAFGPFDQNGKAIPYDKLPVTEALRDGRPAHADFKIRSTRGVDHEIEVSALPIVAEGGQEGAMVFFWARDGKGGE
jgi:PAS domain-containing protein